MSVAMLLCAAALCVAPWRGPAHVRLGVILPAVVRGPRWRVTLPFPVPGRWGRRPVPADPGALAQVVDLLAASLTAGLPAPVAVAAVLLRATDGGGSVRTVLRHASDRLRALADADATARAERASVLVAGPLGLCFLPAFVCLGVLPVVVGLADGMLPGTGL